MRRIVLSFFLILLCTATALGASLKGEIVSLQPENHASMNKGSESGITPGMVFAILDDSFQQIGTFTVLETAAGSARGIYFMNNAADRPEPGMIVVFGEDAPASAGEGYSELVIPAQTVVELTLAENIGSQINNTGDVFALTVKYPVVVNGYEVINAGAKAYGEITDAKAAKGYGRSGALDFIIKFVEAADGTQVPLTIEMERDAKNTYAKAALGTYLSAGLAGGAMKGKKILLETGLEMKVFVPENVTLKIKTGGVSQSGAVKIEARARKAPSDTRVVFVGLNDSFNQGDAAAGRAVAEKLSAFLAYNLQWKTPFNFVQRSRTAQAVQGHFQDLFLSRAPGVLGEQRYNLAALKSLAAQLGADYVILGDVFQYDIQEKTDRDLAKSALNLLAGSGQGTGGLDAVKKVFLMDMAVDIAVYDAARDTLLWEYTYSASHKTSRVLEGIENGFVADIGDSKYFIYKLKDYAFKRSDDPLAFAGTAEGEATLKTFEALFVELQKLL